MNVGHKQNSNPYSVIFEHLKNIQATNVFIKFDETVQDCGSR
jgi:hypothetical protein